MTLLGHIACAALLVLGSAARGLAGSELADTTEAGADHMGPTSVIIDYGSNPIPPEVFESPDYVPPPGYLKNTPRTAAFNAEETLSSPGDTSRMLARNRLDTCIP